jgi:cellobiose phosphorylase
MDMQKITARKITADPFQTATVLFSQVLKRRTVNDALFTDATFTSVIALAGLGIRIPCVNDLFREREAGMLLSALIRDRSSLLLIQEDHTFFLYKTGRQGTLTQVPVSDSLRQSILKSIHFLTNGAGYVNERGEHCMDLTAPDPGPHFGVNLLLGNRLDFKQPIHTTPKSVVDKLGGGSFRSHAFTQVLAMRWDMRQEENGFPANRQFYLLEDGELIFYSRQPQAPAVESAWCRHAQNYTQITYKTHCGLEVTRTIMLLAQTPGLPIATEVQRIAVKNHGTKSRNLRLVYTGMFATLAPHALWEDVVYSNIIMQGGIIKNTDGAVLAVTPDYYPQNLRSDLLFHSTLTYAEAGARFPMEFCTDYNDFVGNGSLYHPAHLNRLACGLARKGPGFFALALPCTVEAGQTQYIDNFTGLVSAVDNPGFTEDSLPAEINALLREFRRPAVFDEHFAKNRRFLTAYRGFLRVISPDKAYESYVNHNLPFQVLYQTFVSRSFSLTQKGYRELGFREIQDVFASMYYFFAMGREQFVRQVLLTWCENVYKFGYTNHNFFWKGKEPGRWSDDGLWLVQAVYRYTELCGNTDFLQTHCIMAGTDAVRPVYQTLKQIIRYSYEISVGKHGLPLIDYADWNDCLKVDSDYLSGLEKEKLYIEDPARLRETLSTYTESVMNAFLLKTAIDELKCLAAQQGIREDAELYASQSVELSAKIQEHAWKKDFFARLLFNRYQDRSFLFLGAAGDGLSLDQNIDGSYYLNSFTWSVLSGCAGDHQIETMLNCVNTHLKTPYGYKLCTEVDLNKISPRTAAGHYFHGDRENAGIFKHASMMAVSAMFKAAKQVGDTKLAGRLAADGYWMLEKVLPYHTMSDPYELKGNPRFCTQYINSRTGEHIGPLLSGTATWLALSVFETLGIEFGQNGLVCDPILKQEEELAEYELKTKEATYTISIKKPKGFCRYKDQKPVITLDGKKNENNIFPLFKDNRTHSIIMDFRI